MARTCEEYVLNELETTGKALEQLFAKLEELNEENERLKAGPDGGYEPHEVEAYKINEPIETVYLRVSSNYSLGGKGGDFDKVPVHKLRAMAGTEEGLRSLAVMREGSYPHNRAMAVERHTYPYVVRRGPCMYGLEFYSDGSAYIYRVHGEGDEPKDGRYFVEPMEEKLERLGLEMLAKSVLKYCDEREKKEAEKGAVD